MAAQAALPRPVLISSVVTAVRQQTAAAGGDPAVMERHLVELCRAYPTLAPEVDTMHRNDGTSETLAKVRGTLPIVFRGTQYNIPVVVWIPARYPTACPRCYVTPTKDMIIKQGHTNVDRNGQVFLPYLQDWSRAHSRLVELCTVMASVFSDMPPVNAKPPGWDEQQAYERSVNQALAESLSAGNPSAYGRPAQQPVVTATPAYATTPTATALPTVQGRVTAQPAYPSYGGTGAAAATAAVSSSSSSSSSSSLAGRQRPPPAYAAAAGSSKTGGGVGGKTAAAAAASATRHARSKSVDDNSLLRDMINQKVVHHCNTIRDSIREAGGRSDALQAGAETIAAGLRGLRTEKETLDRMLAELEERDSRVAAWVEEQDKLAQDPESQNPDRILRASDALSDQLFDQVATIAATEDVMFHLDRALSESVIELQPYLKQVRSLSTKQFLAKALAMKIVEIQRRNTAADAANPPLPARPPPAYRK